MASQLYVYAFPRIHSLFSRLLHPVVRAVASFHHCFTATRVVVPTVARLDRFAAFIPSAPAVARIVFIWVFIPPDCNIMLISDWNPAVFWDLVGVLEVRGGGVPSPTHSHQEQMAVAGLAD